MTDQQHGSENGAGSVVSAQREGRYGLTTLCLGGGGALATAIERV